MRQYMIVYVTHSPPAAHVVAGRLEHEGIKTMIYKEAGSSAFGVNIGKWGEIKVLVHPDDYELALYILENPPELPGGEDYID